MAAARSALDPFRVVPPTAQRRDELAALEVEMPRIELPRGVSRVQVSDDDRASALEVRDWTPETCIRRAREYLRAGRKLQRRASARGAMKRAKRERELARAATMLVQSGICCGIAELCRHQMTPGPERIAMIRERCQGRHREDQGRYAVDVENWIRDLSGDARLTHG